MSSCVLAGPAIAKRRPPEEAHSSRRSFSFGQARATRPLTHTHTQLHQPARMFPRLHDDARYGHNERWARRHPRRCSHFDRAALDATGLSHSLGVLASSSWRLFLSIFSLGKHELIATAACHTHTIGRRDVEQKIDDCKIIRRVEIELLGCSLNQAQAVFVKRRRRTMTTDLAEISKH